VTGLTLLTGCADQAPSPQPTSAALQSATATPTVVVSTPTAAAPPLETPTIVPTAEPTTSPDPTTASEATTSSVETEQSASAPAPQAATFEPTLQEYPVPPASRPHDVAPAPEGGVVWYVAQGSGELGRLDPTTGETRHIPLGQGSAPHGVIVGPDGAPWITDGGLNAIVRVDPETEAVQSFPLPAETGYANLNTAAFDGQGILWFTGQSGVYGRLDPATGQLEVFEAPRGRGPYGIDSTPAGEVYYASLAGSHIAQIDRETGAARPIDPPTAGQGARRVWSDSQGRIWVSEWNAGQMALYNPATGEWREWRLPGDQPMPYAVYVDDQDMVWLSDFGANAIVRFDPATETFEVFPLPSPGANVRQILGRPGEVWGAESGTDKLVVIHTAPEGEEGSLPASSLFDAAAAWEDRSPFRTGLIDSEQAVLGQLPGATVYHLDLQLSDDLLSLQGIEEVYYTNQENEPLSALYFRLFPNLAKGSTSVSAVTVNGLGVEPAYELQNSAMRLPLSPALPPGESVVIRLDFGVQVPSGEGGNYGTFAFKEGVLALAHFYPLIPVYDDEGWNVEIAPFIGDVIYADTSFYLTRVTAPISQTLVASGIEINREQTDTHQIVTFAAGPVRDFYLAASDRFAMTSRTIGQTVLRSYAPVELAAGNEATLNLAAAAMQSFNQRFGPYPFTEFDLVSTTTFALGVEYPGIVAILMNLYDLDGRVRGTPTGPLLEGVVAHEVAHQWFYSVVGNDQVDEPWLDEALAQYATLLYYRDAYGGEEGATGFRRSLERRWERVNRADIPIGLPVRAYDEASYGAIVYGRGPLFLQLLAETMSQETFDAFLADYYQTYKWGVATGADFKQLAEQHCACDLTPLFEAWVYEKPITNN
jgi:virginiamycin B lyase